MKPPPIRASRLCLVALGAFTLAGAVFIWGEIFFVQRFHNHDAILMAGIMGAGILLCLAGVWLFIRKYPITRLHETVFDTALGQLTDGENSVMVRHGGEDLRVEKTTKGNVWIWRHPALDQEDVLREGEDWWLSRGTFYQVNRTKDGIMTSQIGATRTVERTIIEGEPGVICFWDRLCDTNLSQTASRELGELLRQLRSGQLVDAE
jgi:hypothetical protein